MIRLLETRRSWREASFAVLDFETTGLDLDRDHVVSYGLVPVEAGRVTLTRALYRVVRPPIPPPAEAIRVHGITAGELANAPAFADVADELLAALAGRTLVAHAAWIELAFLDRMYADRAPRRRQPAIDVLALAARDRARRPETSRLAELAAAYGIPVARTHHAFGDALTTAQLFLALATRLEGRGRGRLSHLLRAGRPQFATSFARRGLDRTGPIS